jgi:N-sulfoglucosamine sulfohydrolase
MKSKLLIFCFIVLFGLKISAQNNKPNVIIFIADDVSFDDLGCYGNKQVQTPNIDKLAAAGIRFNNFYLTASSCSPSRNSIITGRYPHNTGAAELHTQPPVEMVSFPEMLKNNGYYTVSSGKFHMGEYARRGFDVIHEKVSEVGNGGEEKWMAAITERPKDKPFFMWFAAHDAHRDWGENSFSGTHKPEELKPPFYLADGMKTKTDLAAYYDEIKRFDHYVGQIVAELKRQKVLDNTLIIVMADNGRPFPHSKTG